MRRERLKGESFSATYRIAAGYRFFIRKEVSSVENREFGFTRWLSQLKKLQRLNATFPGIFPDVLDVRVQGDSAYFDLALIPGSITVSDFLLATPSKAEIDVMFSALVEIMDTLHAVHLPSLRGGFDLYLKQEVERALNLCLDDPAFCDFVRYGTVVFNGQSAPGLFARLGEVRAFARGRYYNHRECWTHGNLRLENVLYVPGEHRIVLIDPYEENYIDTALNDYSQILQSCNSRYEIHNGITAHICGNVVELKTPPHPALDAFNMRFKNLLRQRLTLDELMVVDLYEMSQFTRMLPFKKYIAPDKLSFFYAQASVLFDAIVRRACCDERSVPALPSME